MNDFRVRRVVVIAVLSTASGAIVARRDDEEDVGTSTSGLSLAPAPRPANVRLRGEFVIDNPTHFNVGYSVRWGGGAWVNHKLEARHLRRHWHVLDANGRAPRPQLRFDNVANDNRVTDKVYDMSFGRVGDAPGGPVNQPVRYEFVARGNQIDVVRR